MKKPLVIAVLAKSKAHILPLYLRSLLAQTALRSDTIFYIRTNDNKDNTSEVLRDFYNKWNWKYKMVFDDTSVDPSLIAQPNHDWDAKRFSILGAIRQKSIDFANSEGADYFIADCDNIVMPHTIDAIRSVNLPVVAPLLHVTNPTSMYSNFHSDIDDNGYFKNDHNYVGIFYQNYKGLLQMPVVHCTYFIRHDALKSVQYDDGSARFEYVIFSDSLRKAGVLQYLDTREVYGRISFSTNEEEYVADMQYASMIELDGYITKQLGFNGI